MAGTAHLAHTGLEGGHEVHYRGWLPTRFGGNHRPTPTLGLDELLHLAPVGIAIARRVPVGGHGLHQLDGHGQLASLGSRTPQRLGIVDTLDVGDHVLGRSDLVVEEERLQHQHTVAGAHGAQVLLAMHDQGCDAGPLGPLHGRAEQPVGLQGALFGRRQVVARAEIDRIDICQFDEVGDLQGPRAFRCDGLEFLRLDDHRLAVPEVVALHDLVAGHFFAGPLVDFA